MARIVSMLTIRLITNTSNTVSYSIWDAISKEKINTITVNKHSKSYSLEHGEHISTHYESAAYRAILEGIELNIFPTEYSNGWG